MKRGKQKQKVGHGKGAEQYTVRVTAAALLPRTTPAPGSHAAGSCAGLGHTGALFTSYTSAMGLVSQAEERKVAVAVDAHISLIPRCHTLGLDLWPHTARPYLLGV